MSQKRAAARFCVSPATVNRWVRRERAATADERICGSWAEERLNVQRHTGRRWSTVAFGKPRA
jgi:transposase